MRDLRRIAIVAGIWVISAATLAFDPDATIVIDRTAESPLVSVKYSGATASLAELRVNGESIMTRSLNGGSSSGESKFTLNLSTLLDGENELEVRLFDKAGRLLGTQKTVIKHSASKAPVIYVAEPQMGSTVQGAVEIKVGFGQKLKNSYVSFFIDKQFKTISNVAPFDYIWDTSRETNGWHEVEAWVVDDSAETRKSKALRLFVDNPGGRTNRRTATLVRSAAVQPKPKSEPATRTLTFATSAPSAATPKKAPVLVRSVVKTVASQPASAPKTQVAAASSAVRTLISTSNALTVGTSAPMRTSLSVSEPSSATGLRFLTPTGKRNAGAATSRVLVTTVAKPTQSANSIQAKVLVSNSPTAPNAATSGVVAKPATARELKEGAPISAPSNIEVPQPSKTIKTVSISTEAYQPSQLALASNEPATSTAKAMTTPVAKPVEMSKSKNPVAPAPAAVAKVSKTTTTLIRVEKGVKIAAKGSFAVVMDGDLVEFDVQPRFDEGVPMSPFRHLIEKKGGTVEWENSSKSVSAQAMGHEIFLQIGTRVARIDRKDVSLELKPYIEKGRTIVPLSFIRESLHVNVDYDRATGHVLITQAK